MSVDQFSPTNDLFVITSKDSEELCTPVFALGNDSSSEAVAAFMTRDDAQTYLSESGWADTDTIAEITPQAVVKWLVAVRADGPTVIVVNPERDEQEKGHSQSVLLIDDLLTELGGMVVTRVGESRGASTEVLVTYMSLQCLACGSKMLRTTSQSVPHCCGEKMLLETLETRSTPVDEAPGKA